MIRALWKVAGEPPKVLTVARQEAGRLFPPPSRAKMAQELRPVVSALLAGRVPLDRRSAEALAVVLDNEWRRMRRQLRRDGDAYWLGASGEGGGTSP